MTDAAPREYPRVPASTLTSVMAAGVRTCASLASIAPYVWSRIRAQCGGTCVRVSAPLCVWFRVCVCVAPSLCVRAHDVRACACLCAQHALCEHSMVQTTCRGGDVGGDGHGMRPAPGDGQQLPAERRIKRALPLAAPLADALPSTMPGGQRARPHCAPLLRQYTAADPPLRRTVGCLHGACCKLVRALQRCSLQTDRPAARKRLCAAAVFGLCHNSRLFVCLSRVVADRLPAEDCAARADDLHRVRAAVGRLPRRRHCVLSVGLAAQASCHTA